MTQKEGKNKKREISNWWYWVLIIIFILTIFGVFDNSDYKECVDDCVQNAVSCSYSTSIYYTCDECTYDLESCINWCDR